MALFGAAQHVERLGDAQQVGERLLGRDLHRLAQDAQACRSPTPTRREAPASPAISLEQRGLADAVAADEAGAAGVEAQVEI